MKYQIFEALEQAEDNGKDREEAAQLLERFADAVRRGYTQLPEDRGEWWHEVHGGEGREEEIEDAVAEVTRSLNEVREAVRRPDVTEEQLGDAHQALHDARTALEKVENFKEKSDRHPTQG